MTKGAKTGEAWINSRQKRVFETGLVVAASPVLAGVALVACGVIARRHGFGAVFHRAERSLYPGDSFPMTKIGNPEDDDPVLRVCRQAMIDELPQAIDILRGRMSLIGPRADKPAHIDRLFEVIDDQSLRRRWSQVRRNQRPGLISSYAVHSHRRNLAGKTEEARFSKQELLEKNAELRAGLDTYDYDQASFRHDVRLLGAAASMAAGNYTYYARKTLRRGLWR